MLEFGLRRTAASGFSPMPMTSVAGTIADARAVDAGMRGQLRLDRVGAADQLHGKIGIFGERLERARDFSPGCVVAPHRVNGDANHLQLSSTSTTFLPP